VEITRYMAGAIAAGALAVAGCGDDLLEDGWNKLSDEEQALACEVFITDEMSDEDIAEVVAATNEKNDTDVSPEEFKTFLEEHC
jgi:outer membrane murein-binding lipoprotein Lpp